MKKMVRNGTVQCIAGMAELVDATDSKPVDASHESSILSPGTDERSERCAGRALSVADSLGTVARVLRKYE